MVEGANSLKLDAALTQISLKSTSGSRDLLKTKLEIDIDISRLGEPKDREKAKVIFNKLYSILNNGSQRYNLAEVKKALKNISAEQLKAILAKVSETLTGEDLISAIFGALGKDEAACYSKEANDALSNLKKSAAEYAEKPSAETKAKFEEADRAYQVMLGTVIKLRPEYNEIVESTKAAGETVKRSADNDRLVRETAKKIAGADFPDLLALEEKGYVKNNERLKELIGQRLIELIKEDASAVDPERLQPLLGYVRLDYNQKLISFKMHKGVNTYVVLIKRDGAGPWQIKANKGLPGSDFYIEEKNGVLTMRRTEGVPDPRFETVVIDVNSKAVSEPKPAITIRYPDGLSKEQKEAADLILTLNPDIVKDGNLVNRLWTALNDGRISKEEAKAFDLEGKGGDLFRAIDNYMRAGLSGGDSYLDLNELREAVKVMRSFADHAKISLADAAKLYRSMYLVDLDFNGIDAKIGELTAAARAGLANFDGLAGLSENEIGGKLSALKALMQADLFALLTAQIKRGAVTSADEVGVFTFRSAMASMTGNYAVFHVPELKSLVNQGKIAPFKPRKPETSAEDFGEWVKEAKVKSEESKGEKSEKADDQKQRELLSKLQLAKKPTEALEIYKKNYSELKGSTQALEILKESLQTALKLAIDNKTLVSLIDEYNSCEKLADGLDSEVKTGLKGNVYAYKFQLALELAKSEKQSEKDLAYTIINAIPDGSKIAWTKTDRAGNVSSVSLTKAEAKFVLASERLKETAPMDAAIKEPAKYSALELAAAYMYRAEVKLEQAKTNPEREAAFADYKEAYKKAATGEAEAGDKQKAIEYRERAKKGMSDANQAISSTRIAGKDKTAKAANKEIEAIIKRLQKEMVETIKGETKAAEAAQPATKAKGTGGGEKKAALSPALVNLAKERIKVAYESSNGARIYWDSIKENGVEIDEGTKQKVRAYIKGQLKLKKGWELVEEGKYDRIKEKKS
ncbi:MAG: hypothetical protein JW873_06675 [Candidatus Saganbacteria bacterium]|nr:hypothetical protein [Candidatus Saganbacteria bacterium]